MSNLACLSLPSCPTTTNLPPQTLRCRYSPSCRPSPYPPPPQANRPPKPCEVGTPPSPAHHPYPNRHQITTLNPCSFGTNRALPHHYYTRPPFPTPPLHPPGRPAQAPRPEDGEGCGGFGTVGGLGSPFRPPRRGLWGDRSSVEGSWLLGLQVFDIRRWAAGIRIVAAKLAGGNL